MAGENGCGLIHRIPRRSTQCEERLGILSFRHYRSPACGDRITVRPGTLCTANGERGSVCGRGRGARLAEAVSVGQGNGMTFALCGVSTTTGAGFLILAAGVEINCGFAGLDSALSISIGRDSAIHW
jgi:hypothetical protein